MGIEQQSITDPDGRLVVFDAGSHLHLADGRRSWLLDHIDEIVATVARPDYREDDPRPGRERFYRQNVLRPRRWMRVVVDFNEGSWLDRDGAGSGQRPPGVSPMTLTIASYTFAHHHYDPRGDVLYLSVEDYEGQPASAFATPEGHNVEYDGLGLVVGVTLTNVRWLLDRDGELTITWPAWHVSADDLSEALRTAA